MGVGALTPLSLCVTIRSDADSPKTRLDSERIETWNAARVFTRQAMRGPKTRLDSERIETHVSPIIVVLSDPVSEDPPRLRED